jgi:hypothetical protein
MLQKIQGDPEGLQIIECHDVHQCHHISLTLRNQTYFRIPQYAGHELHRVVWSRISLSQTNPTTSRTYKPRHRMNIFAEHFPVARSSGKILIFKKKKKNENLPKQEA